MISLLHKLPSETDHKVWTKSLKRVTTLMPWLTAPLSEVKSNKIKVRTFRVRSQTTHKHWPMLKI